ncbi:hypothetical protein B7Z00_04060 [Candidatus Saccharibacteria bacterium 32-50-10]|nr:MAG: hypothetical protein B7Z00_04060 [Candidatus Saccharibacteria bacterium 32-50-10]
MLYLKRADPMGFTIIELLVAITIIAILFAATNVAYRSVQARSRSSTASSTAAMVTKKAESWYSALGTYPSYTQLSTGKINAADSTLTGPAESRITDAANILLNAATVNPTNEKQVAYKPCTAGGAQVEWYDAMTSTVKFTGVGGGSSTAACA